MQIENILWTELTLPSIILMSCGAILWLLGSFIDTPVRNYLLSLAYPRVHQFAETRFSACCVRKHTQSENLYNRVVNILIVAGYWAIAVGFILFFMPILMGWGLALSLFMAYFTYLRIKTPTIRKRTKKSLEASKNSAMFKHLYEDQES